MHTSRNDLEVCNTSRFVDTKNNNSKISLAHVRYIRILTRLRGFRVKIANISRLHCLAIPIRDLGPVYTLASGLKLALVYKQPRPQGPFSWLWRWGGVTAFWASPRFGHPHSQIPSVLGIPRYPPGMPKSLVFWSSPPKKCWISRENRKRFRDGFR